MAEIGIHFVTPPIRLNVWHLLELENQRIGVSEMHRICCLMDFEALKLCNVRSADQSDLAEKKSHGTIPDQTFHKCVAS